MKKNTPKLQTEYFRFRFSPMHYALIAAGFIVSAAGIVSSVYHIARSGIHSFNDVLIYPFLALVSAALIVILAALLIRARYVVDDRYFITQFGIIKSRCEIGQITSVVLDRDTDKLTVNAGETYFVPNIAANENEKLVRALLKRNPDIDYSYTVRENKPDGDGDNKSK